MKLYREIATIAAVAFMVGSPIRLVHADVGNSVNGINTNGPSNGVGTMGLPTRTTPPGTPQGTVPYSPPVKTGANAPDLSVPTVHNGMQNDVTPNSPATNTDMTRAGANR